MLLLYVLLFLISSFTLYVSGGRLVSGLARIARFLGLKEFVVAFFVMAFAASLPNLVVGITAAFRAIPQLSFGDVAGNNIITLTVAAALAVFFSKDRFVPTESRLIQTSAIFTALAAILPLLLVLDGELSRLDGLILILLFLLYNFWLFSKKERFSQVYDDNEDGEIAGAIKKSKLFIKDAGKTFLGIILLIGAAYGIVISAVFFAQFFKVPIILIGLLITGLGSALPETYFAVISARRGDTWMVLGNLMGAVIVPATLVLGVVALIHPIVMTNFSQLAAARFFLIASALFFYFFARTGKKITKKEGIILLTLYVLFVITELLLV